MERVVVGVETRLVSKRMPTNCKAALKKWEETTGRKCSEATEVNAHLDICLKSDR